MLIFTFIYVLLLSQHFDNEVFWWEESFLKLSNGQTIIEILNLVWKPLVLCPLACYQCLDQKMI